MTDWWQGGEALDHNHKTLILMPAHQTHCDMWAPDSQRAPDVDIDIVNVSDIVNDIAFEIFVPPSWDQSADHC